MLPVCHDGHKGTDKTVKDGLGDGPVLDGVIEAGEDVVEDDTRDHARVEAGGKVVVEVEDAAHHPEGDVVKGPADQQPAAGV